METWEATVCPEEGGQDGEMMARGQQELIEGTATLELEKRQTGRLFLFCKCMKGSLDLKYERIILQNHY